MNKVPKMLSSKDLSYLSDMLNWNYFATKTYYDAYNRAQNEEIKEVLYQGYNMHLQHYQKLLNFLG